MGVGGYHSSQTRTYLAQCTTLPCEGGGRDEDSPATIYLIWLSWLHSRRPGALGHRGGNGEREGGRDAGKHGLQSGCLASLSMRQLNGPGMWREGEKKRAREKKKEAVSSVLQLPVNPNETFMCLDLAEKRR